MKKNLLSAFIILGTAIPFLAQVKIYGPLRNGSTQDLQMSFANPSNGSVTTISSLTFANTYNGGAGSVINTKNKRYYMQSNGRLWGMDLVTGNAVTSPTVNPPFAGYFDLMAYNCSDSTIYGVLRNASTQDLSLAKINTLTGSVTTVSSNTFATTYLWNGWSTIDPKKKIYYVQSGTKLWGISLTTGNVITSPTVTVPYTGYFDMMCFNYSDSTIYGVMRNATGTVQPIQMSKINPVTGSVTTISSNTFAINYVLNGGVTIDPINKIYYLQSAGQLFGVSLTTGNAVSSPTVVTPYTGYFDLMQFNASYCDGSPLSASPTFKSTSHFELYPNPANGSFRLKIDNEIKNGQISLFNSLGQKIYEQKVLSGENKINISGIATGLYHYVLLWESATAEQDKQYATGKLVIE